MTQGFGSSSWDGRERRKHRDESESSEVILARIEERQIAHNEIVQKHVIDDTVMFASIKRDIGWLQKIVWAGLGIVGFIQFVK